MSNDTTHDHKPDASAEGSSCCCSSNPRKEESCGCGCDAGSKCCPFRPDEKTLAFWVLRIWLGARALLTGLSKFETKELVRNTSAAATTAAPVEDYASAAPAAANAVEETVYRLGAHHGLPKGGAWTLDSLSELPGWIMPKWALHLLDATLGYILLALGLTLLLGIFTRASLLFQGILYTMLTAGFILITKEPGSSAGISMLGVHVVLIVAALALAKHNKLSIEGFLACRKHKHAHKE
ncbi:MAG: hypothetical protein LBV54_00785 [Puniceicoccales bacterium]|jgi:thiosulfate dehydrogenase [quinone] large subunit|nr:hypothetical protein [Puniceicoccales bacterium]